MDSAGNECAVNGPKVFVSYSHDSSGHRERVLEFTNALRSHGINAEIDRYHVRPPKGWPNWCEEQLRPENSRYVLMICTETYLKRIQDKVAADEGRGVYWEGTIIYEYLYDAKGNTRFIPVLFSDVDDSSIPIPIRNHTRYRIGAFDLADPGYQGLYRELTGQPSVIKSPVGDVIRLGKMLGDKAQPVEARPVRTDFPVIATEVDITRVLKYAPTELIGREDELKLLNEAWAKVQNTDKSRPRVLTIVALGGEGKTALVAKWAAELAAQDWPGCDSVFAWSFYSQGIRDQQTASSDLFVNKALEFFGDSQDKAFAASPASAFEKGHRLARIVGKRRCLLILDGLEPLQHSPNALMPGELKDQGIAALLKGLASASYGLCVVTTRFSLHDLKVFWQTTAPEVSLRRLSIAAGSQLLKSLGVTGGAREFEAMVRDVKGHALTLTLLGGYLSRAFHGDIRKRDRVKFEKANEKMDGGHAFRAIAAYEQWFLFDGGDEGRRELAVLRLMGLFDRPVDAGCLNALLQAPIIPGLTEPLVNLAEDDWEFCLSGLEIAKLITVNREPSAVPQSKIALPQSLDAHPHLRAYFAKQLGEQNPDSWCAAHRRLYEHLCATTNEGDTPTLEGLQPLYQAVVHGCYAGLQQEVLNSVYRDRTLKGTDALGGFYSHRKGFFGADLGALGCFFSTPWDQVTQAITPPDQAWVLGLAGFSLRATGRLAEAERAARSALELRVSQKDWRNAAANCDVLRGINQTLGHLQQARVDAEKAVEYADQCEDGYIKVTCRADLGDTLHQAGLTDQALQTFREAEAIQGARPKKYPKLNSWRGAWYCDLLLADSEQAAWRTFLKRKLASISTQASGSGCFHEAKDSSVLVDSCELTLTRARGTFELAEVLQDLSSMGLDMLTSARAHLYSAVLLSANSQLDTALREAADSVNLLYRSGELSFIPRALLTRAWLRFLHGMPTGPNGAQSDLDEAWEIAENSAMQLHMADIHLYRARMFFQETEYPWESPNTDLAAASKFIEQCGYWRRKDELEDAKCRLSQQPL